MEDIAEFLAARLAEAQADAPEVHQEPCSMYDIDAGARFCDCGYPARVLAQVAAGRAILSDYERDREHLDTATLRDDQLQACIVAQGRVRQAIGHLAAVYSDHPDYKEGWRP